MKATRTFATGANLFGAPGRWLASIAVALVGLVGCQGADAYYRFAQQHPGSDTVGSDGGSDAQNLPGDDGLFSDFALSRRDADAAEDGDPGAMLTDAGKEAGCGLCALDVLYQCEGTAANTIRATFSLVNDTPDPVPLSEITIRYWFTAGVGGSPWMFACDNGMLGRPPNPISVTAAVIGTFVRVNPARPGADMYFEVGFLPGAGNLPPGLFSLFRTRVFRADYSTITQTDDYSFNPRITTFAQSSQITMYRNGMLASGDEPR